MLSEAMIFVAASEARTSHLLDLHTYELDRAE